MLRAQHSMRTACRLAGLSTHALYYRPEKNARPLNLESIELIRKVVEDILRFKEGGGINTPQRHQAEQ